MFGFYANKKQSQPNLNSVVNGGNFKAQNYRQEGGNAMDVQNEAYINSKMEEVENQRLEFMKKNPNFDMRAEMENSDFVNYVWNMGLSVEDAFFLVHKDEIINAVTKRTKRSMMMKDRIAENGAGKNSPASVKKNPKDMSDKEIDAIIERVNRGEKISF